MTPSDLYFPTQAFKRAANAGVKPSTDFEDVLKGLGATGLGLRRGYFPNLKTVHLRNIIHNLLVLWQMPRDKVLVLQYPMQYHIRQMFHKAKKRGNKVIVIIHDINWLRDKHIYNFSDVLEGADVIIAHTPNMARWLNERFPNAKTVVLDVFDYIQAKVPQAKAPEGSYSVVFAGNLGKSDFLRKLNIKGNDLKLVLYGVGCPDSLVRKPFVDYRGSCMPEEIPEKIASNSFGLVWDGASTTTCKGGFGQYLRYNAPYKLSSYIAAGIPTVVWSQMGIAEFVTKQNIGIAVDSLDNLESVLAGISNKMYAEMRANVSKLQKKVSTGGFAREALTKAIAML